MTPDTTPSPKRRRAPAMSPEDRRAMIIASALPLVAEHGAKVTTAVSLAFGLVTVARSRPASAHWRSRPSTTP